MQTIKRKILLFLFLLFFLTLAAIANSISETLHLWESTKNNNQMLIEQKNKIDKTSMNIGNHVGENAFSENLPVVLFFEKVSHSATLNSLKLISLYPEERSGIENYTVIHRQIYVEGGYKNILNFVYYLERELKLAHVSSCAFELKKDIKSKKEQLFALVQIDNIINNE